MEALPATFGSRRNEDIALDMMKFIASTTQYGRGTTTPGFTGITSPKPEDYAAQLIGGGFHLVDTLVPAES